MQKRVYIIHGWGGSPDSNWFAWMKAQLEEQGFAVTVPQLPRADFPLQSEWIAYLQKLIVAPDQNTFLVGHSLGCMAILRFLETLAAEQEVGGVILTAGFSRDLGTIKPIENFFAQPLDYAKVKNACQKFVAFNADDDPYVPLEEGKVLQEKLGAKLIVLHGAGHLVTGTDNFTFPEAVEELLQMAQ